jgi:DNA-binding NarL/FixJ family response regulator
MHVVGLHKRTVTRHIVGSRMEAVDQAETPIRVLIADDHRLFAEALAAILAADEQIRVVGHAGDGGEAIELTARLDPDVVLMDISMPVLDGIEAAAKIREERPETRILILTGSNSRADVDRARQAGAAGYVTKDRIAAELIDAIREVVA